MITTPCDFYCLSFEKKRQNSENKKKSNFENFLNVKRKDLRRIKKNIIDIFVFPKLPFLETYAV
jgi:hypothetical protein